MTFGNKNLRKAAKNKKDEFYTRIEDIVSEMQHYREHFKDKVVYLNCDDPNKSAFVEYFTKQFEVLGLKKLIATCHKQGGDFSLFSQGETSRGVKLVYGGGAERSLPDPEHLTVEKLQGDGDFRSSECVELLKEADIVVTNPPFSLFREYIALLMEHDKNFIIVGNMNAVSYKEIFPLIKENRVWTGMRGFSGGMDMVLGYEEEHGNYKVDAQGRILKNISGVIWFTNLDHGNRKRPLDLYRRYDLTPEDYPKYDNYDAIEVSKVSEIPEDYEGVMGVPLTFIGKHCPDQFEIVSGWNAGKNTPNPGADWIEIDSKGTKMMWNGPAINGKAKYFRVLIRHKNPKKIQ